ncbi:MAG TPA: beta-galactosidase GalA [Bacteroidota bacterium]|nr:beta-galactosidase GalA [Bacteroidota bacterium]
MDFNWRFAFGHATDVKKDFNFASAYFSYWAKAGYGDGAASPVFDDRAWRVLDVPHDWCVELPFDRRGSFSHGYKAMGRNFPEQSIGWYRKNFFIPQSDTGRTITLEFDGVFRNSIVWVNGFYCGTEHSGYAGFGYDITDYLKYGAENVIAVRVDASMEEGWFYEGAGIYRHVRLVKTSPLHVAPNGTFITTDLASNSAIVTVRTRVVNESSRASTFAIDEAITDRTGTLRAKGSLARCMLAPGEEKEFTTRYTIKDPALWSLEDPQMHRLETVIRAESQVVDTYESSFGIRTVRFDANNGFFLNGRHVMICGTNMHQDHAGVGIALPDALHDYRIKRLKEMGSNAIRTSHNPPTPEMLDACDRLGMLVLDENRLMGTNAEHRDALERMMKRDRNHPSVILWSLGNEEWAIEGTITGARIARTMQEFASLFDSSRAFTTAVSGGWDNGIGQVMQVMGYNYIVQGDIDQHHKKFPWQAGIGTEESNTCATRGVYVTDPAMGHLAPTNRMPENVGTESGWNFYAARPFLSGVFYWTGFDYRGEMHPFDWPAVSSQFGLLDLCGYPKDTYYYLKSWWTTKPVLHVIPDWNAVGQQGKISRVTVYGNSPEIELSLNGRSLGKKLMPKNGHLEWQVAYEPGILTARGLKGDAVIVTDSTGFTAQAQSLSLATDRTSIASDGRDACVIEIRAVDAQGRTVPTDNHQLTFSLEGPGKILGVGNGDPSSHEPDRFIEQYSSAQITDLKELSVPALAAGQPETQPGFDDSKWKPALHSGRTEDWQKYVDTLLVIRGTFELPVLNSETEVSLYPKSIVDGQSVYINGHLLASDIKRNARGQSYTLDSRWLKNGKNEYAVTGQRFRKTHQWDEPNTDPGLVGIRVRAGNWKRSLFNGLAQIIVQSTTEPGTIVLKASGEGITPATLTIPTQQQLTQQSSRSTH